MSLNESAPSEAKLLCDIVVRAGGGNGGDDESPRVKVKLIGDAKWSQKMLRFRLVFTMEIRLLMSLKMGFQLFLEI